MKYGNVWINCINDIGENKNGYFCQVYTDEEMSNEIDYFFIHPWDCDCTDEKEVEKFIERFAETYYNPTENKERYIKERYIRECPCEPLILEPEDWTEDEWNAILKIFNMKSASRIKIDYKFEAWGIKNN